MKKNKLEKIQQNIEKNLKDVLNDINDLIQNAKRNNWTLNDCYHRVSSALTDLQQLLESELNRNREVDVVYGFESSVFEIREEDDGGDK